MISRYEAINLLDNLKGFIEDSQNNDYDGAIKIAISDMQKLEKIEKNVHDFEFDFTNCVSFNCQCGRHYINSGAKWHMVADGDFPRCEEKVFIVAERKYRDGATRKIYTTAMYEDGTIRENDSSWYWEDIDGEYDEEEDCLIVPRGWYEYKSYTPDGELNYEIDDKVIAWMELPEFSEVE